MGQRPVLVSVDGGVYQREYVHFFLSKTTVGVVQSEEFDFGVNGESNLDLQFSMALVGKTQPVTLYQTGDLEQGRHSLDEYRLSTNSMIVRCIVQ